MGEIKDWRGDLVSLEDVKAGVGPGWGSLVENLVNDLFALGWDGDLHQIKEKFGGLRFYIGQGSEEIYARILEAENESFKICEECGAPGKCWPGHSWMKTHCSVCNEVRRRRREEGV